MKVDVLSINRYNVPMSKRAQKLKSKIPDKKQKETGKFKMSFDLENLEDRDAFTKYWKERLHA